MILTIQCILNFIDHSLMLMVWKRTDFTASVSVLLYIKPSTLLISGTEAELQVSNLCLLLDINIDAKNVPLACGPLLLSLLSPKPLACFSPLLLQPHRFSFRAKFFPSPLALWHLRTSLSSFPSRESLAILQTRAGFLLAHIISSYVPSELSIS